MFCSIPLRGIVVLIVVSTWASASALAQTTWYVDGGNCPGPGSGTPADPFCTIQAGIDASTNGDSVEVADGVYTGAGNRDLDFGGRLITLRSENGADACVIDCQAHSADPHRAFLFQTGETDEAILEGFTIRNGYAPDAVGGAVYILNSSPTIADCVFEYNVAVALPGVEHTGKGGAIYVGEGGSPSMSDCIFNDNSVTSGGVNRTGNGGAIANLGGTMFVANCQFHRNTAIRTGSLGGSGGAISTRIADTTLQGCLFVDNVADWCAGAIVCSSQPSLDLWNNLTMADCTFVGNKSVYEGGAVWNGKGDLRSDNCRFIGNSTDRGAALFTWFPGPTAPHVIANSIVVGNQAGIGAAIGHCSGPNRKLFICNCTVAANAGGRGGISNSDVCGAAYMEVSNSVVWGNDPTQILSDPGATIIVTYTCAQDSAGEPWFGDACIDHDPQFAGGPSGSWTGSATYEPVSGQTTFFDADADWVPGEHVDKFLNADTSQYLQSIIVANTETTVTAWGDFAALSTIGASYQIHDYHVHPASRVIDAADNAAAPDDELDLDGDGDTTEPIPVDLDGDPRFVDDPYRWDSGAGTPPIVDMGSYEFQLIVYPTDFDADWDVDGDDFAVVASCLSGPGVAYLPGCEPADLDGDGDVDMQEFCRFQQQFSGP
jgi:hypothetical protein